MVVILAAVAALAACVPPPSGVKSMPDSDPVPAGSTVGFYGDSLTYGLGATSPELRWSTLLCARRGWLEVNPSVSGLGFVTARGTRDLPAELIAAQPDLVIVALGHNDLLALDRAGDAVHAAIDADITRLRAGLPEARIVVLALFSPLSFEPPQVAVLNGWLRDAAGAADAVFVSQSSGWLVGHPDWTVDGIHFSDVGNAEIARLVDAELHRVLH